MRLTRLPVLNTISHGKTDCIKSNAENEHLILKRIGIWGFVFFAVKGILWVIISVLVLLTGIDY